MHVTIALFLWLYIRTVEPSSEYDMTKFQINEMFKAIAGMMVCLVLVAFGNLCEVLDGDGIFRPGMSKEAGIQMQAHLECSKALRATHDVKFFSHGSQRAIMKWDLTEGIKLVSCKVAKK